VRYQQLPDREGGTAAGLSPGGYRDQDERALHRWYGAQSGRQTQPGRQEPRLRYPPQQADYQQPPRNSYDQSDPSYWQVQPTWLDQAYQGQPYQGQPSYPQQEPYGQQLRQPSSTPDPQYGPPPGQPAYQRQPQYPPQSHGQYPYQHGQPYHGQQPYPPQGYHGHSYQQAPRKRRRVFLWVFLAIQALFIVWIIAGVAAVHAAPTQAQLAQGCYNNNWYPLFKSQADCVQHYGGALNDAGTAGKAIGVGLVIGFWMVVDVILGISYGIYRLARRSA
jgi:hypothetical protein